MCATRKIVILRSRALRGVSRIVANEAVIFRGSQVLAPQDLDGTGFAKTCIGAAECESVVMMDFCCIPQSRSVVPAKAGTHNLRPASSFRTAAPALHRDFPAYGSLLSQGRRSGCA